MVELLGIGKVIIAVLLGCVMLSVLIKAVVNITRICHAVPGGV